VLSTAAPARQPGLLVWARMLQAVGASETSARQLLTASGPVELDEAAAALVDHGPRLFVVDDIDLGGQRALEFLGLLDTRLRSRATGAIVTATASLGIGHERRLGGLDRQSFGTLIGMPPGEILDAAWLATRGLPRQGRALARELTRLPDGTDPVVHLALQAVSGTYFLEADAEFVRLLETALDRADAPSQRALLLARLARELLGDAATLPHRRDLIEEAVKLARVSGDQMVLARAVGSSRGR